MALIFPGEDVADLLKSFFPGVIFHILKGNFGNMSFHFGNMPSYFSFQQKTRGKRPFPAGWFTLSLMY